MGVEILFRKTFRALEQAIGIAQKRQTIIASNLSNLDTPGFTAKDIDFEKALALALDSGNGVTLAATDSRHLGGPKEGVGFADPCEDTVSWNGYNRVDIDREMMKLTQNNLIYKAAVEALLRKVSLLKEVIREGGR